MQLPPPDKSARNAPLSAGFTLIELSIVLVVIGLIVGGILTGRSLIEQAQQRAQITQIERYRTATNTFYAKYNALPGDLTPTQAAAFGFVSRGGGQYDGDGNGLVQTYWWGQPASYVPNADAEASCINEVQLFWNDLSTAKLIGDAMVGAVPDNWQSTGGPGGKYAMSQIFPAAAYNNNSHIVFMAIGGYFDPSTQYFSTFSAVSCYSGPGIFNTPNFNFSTFSGLAAQAIDTKIDDGNGLTGGVMATFNPGTPPGIQDGCHAYCVLPSGSYNISGASGACDLSATGTNQCELAFKF